MSSFVTAYFCPPQSMYLFGYNIQNYKPLLLLLRVPEHPYIVIRDIITCLQYDLINYNVLYNTVQII